MIGVAAVLTSGEGVLHGGDTGVTTEPAWVHDSLIHLLKRY